MFITEDFYMNSKNNNSLCSKAPENSDKYGKCGKYGNLGLVSVSFRQLSPDRIAELVSECGLSGVEWGADVHCRPDSAESVQKVCGLSEKCGIKCFAYGSYYRAGSPEQSEFEFEKVLEAAKRIHAPIVRVWAYVKGSDEATKDEYLSCVTDLKRICALAKKENIIVSLECHNNTFTDNYKSALALLDDVACDNLTMYWQPNQFKDLAYNIQSAAALAPYTTNVHVFNWSGKDKMPLSGAVDTWKRYVSELEKGTRSHNYLLEFMPCGTPEELPAEVIALKEIFS